MDHKELIDWSTEALKETLGKNAIEIDEAKNDFIITNLYLVDNFVIVFNNFYCFDNIIFTLRK